MANVIFYGTISVLPLIIGAVVGFYLNVKEKIIGTITAFGAGALVAALTFGLMEESFKLGGFDNSIIGFAIGALIFVIGDLIIIKVGGRGHKRVYNIKRATSGWGIVLGAILDGIPESLALGIGLALNPKLGFLILIAIMLSNMPESISSAYDLKRANKSVSKIILTWVFVAIISLIFVILGYTVFANISPNITSTFESLAAGAILAMIASTMMPEAYREGGVPSSLMTVFGFLAIFIISKLGV